MLNQPSSNSKLEVLSWEGEGYHPLVISGDWLVALMNWEQRFHYTDVGKIERHNETDEVFVLLKGNSVLFVKTDQGLLVYDMQPGMLYNVGRGTWHNVIGSRDATWLIVEAKNTTIENSNYTALTEEDKTSLTSQYPEWLKKLSGTAL
jgi:mannose-6-phosphate isomerase-like protein (cupin superfamily)